MTPNGQIGNKPTQYDFSKFDEYDSRGNLVTSSEIEFLKNSLAAIYSNLPSFQMYSKEMVDAWVESAMEDQPHESFEEYQNHNDFLCVAVITSGFFEGHKIVIKSITQSGNDFKIDYSVVGVDGQLMKDAQKMDFIVKNIVHLQIYEQALEDTIKTEKDKLN